MQASRIRTSQVRCSSVKTVARCSALLQAAKEKPELGPCPEHPPNETRVTELATADPNLPNWEDFSLPYIILPLMVLAGTIFVFLILEKINKFLGKRFPRYQSYALSILTAAESGRPSLLGS